MSIFFGHKVSITVTNLIILLAFLSMIIALIVVVIIKRKKIFPAIAKALRYGTEGIWLIYFGTILWYLITIGTLIYGAVFCFLFENGSEWMFLIGLAIISFSWLPGMIISLPFRALGRLTDNSSKIVTLLSKDNTQETKLTLNTSDNQKECSSLETSKDVTSENTKNSSSTSNIETWLILAKINIENYEGFDENKLRKTLSPVYHKYNESSSEKKIEIDKLIIYFMQYCNKVVAESPSVISKKKAFVAAKILNDLFLSINNKGIINSYISSEGNLIAAANSLFERKNRRKAINMLDLPASLSTDKIYVTYERLTRLYKSAIKRNKKVAIGLCSASIALAIIIFTIIGVSKCSADTSKKNAMAKTLEKVQSSFANKTYTGKNGDFYRKFTFYSQTVEVETTTTARTYGLYTYSCEWDSKEYDAINLLIISIDKPIYKYRVNYVALDDDMYAITSFYSTTDSSEPQYTRLK